MRERKMAARFVSLVRVIGRTSQLACPALNRVAHLAKPAHDFATAVQVSTRFQFGNFQFLGRTFTTLTSGWQNDDKLKAYEANPDAFTDHKSSLLQPSRLLPSINVQSQRSHIRFSRTHGTQKTVKPVVKRFLRLDWGGWIRTMTGKNKKLYSKWWKRRQRLRRHVFLNNTQNRLLNHMITGYWKRPKYYVDDPYEPYHVRHDINKRSTRDPY